MRGGSPLQLDTTLAALFFTLDVHYEFSFMLLAARDFQRHFDNVLTQYITNSRTDAEKTDVCLIEVSNYILPKPPEKQ